jgi:glycosyltransferase involved in cell wall biosynthesis
MQAHLALGYKPRRTAIIYNGIDPDQFKPDAVARVRVRREIGIADNVIVAAHIARVDPMKDQQCFLAAMAELPNVHALMIGTGTEELPAAANIHRLGERADVARLLPAADIIVSSSAFGEGFSNAIAEGMSCGLPAIATDVGDTRLIVGDAGVIVAPRDSNALAAAIRGMAEEPADSRAARGANARRRIIEHFSLERARQRFSDTYDAMSKSGGES